MDHWDTVVGKRTPLTLHLYIRVSIKDWNMLVMAAMLLKINLENDEKCIFILNCYFVYIITCNNPPPPTHTHLTGFAFTARPHLSHILHTPPTPPRPYTLHTTRLYIVVLCPLL